MENEAEGAAKRPCPECKSENTIVDTSGVCMTWIPKHRAVCKDCRHRFYPVVLCKCGPMAEGTEDGKKVVMLWPSEMWGNIERCTACHRARREPPPRTPNLFPNGPRKETR